MISAHLRLQTTRRRIVVLTAASLAALAGIVPIAASAKPSSPAFGPKEAPLGKPYASWMGEWGKWAFGGPTETNPLLNLQGCDTWEQPDPINVWFLSANGPGSASVTCSVPAGVPIAITPGGLFDWHKPGEEAKLAEYMKTFATSVRKPTLSVDGVKVDATKYLVTSPILTTKIIAPEFGPNSGPDAGEVVMQAKGWMLMLKGLSAGQHTVTISDQLSNLDANGAPILKKGKPTWLLSKVEYSLAVGAGPSKIATNPVTTTAPTTTPPPTTTAPIDSAPAAPSLGPVLFKDDFSDTSSGWIDDIGGGWTMGYRDGKYQIGVDPGNGNHVSPGHKQQPNLQNSRIEIDFELTAGDGAFVVHCYDATPEGVNTDNAIAAIAQEPEHIYVGVSPKAGIGAYVSVGGQRTAIRSGDANATRDAFRPVNRLIVECKGDSGKLGNVRVFLNGVPVLDAPVAIMPSGDGMRPALEAFRGLPTRAEVVFDNLVVTQLL